MLSAIVLLNLLLLAIISDNLLLLLLIIDGLLLVLVLTLAIVRDLLIIRVHLLLFSSAHHGAAIFIFLDNLLHLVAWS